MHCNVKSLALVYAPVELITQIIPKRYTNSSLNKRSKKRGGFACAALHIHIMFFVERVRARGGTCSHRRVSSTKYDDESEGDEQSAKVKYSEIEF